MKTTIKLLSVAILALVPAFIAGGKVETAPGVQKKVPLEIYNVVISPTPTSVTISWSTTQPSEGSVIIEYELDGVGYLDDKTGIRHEIVVTDLAPGHVYGYRIGSYSATYGSSTPVIGSFETPTS
jgi:hypothetical protein